jgi:hypothetical protein
MKLTDHARSRLRKRSITEDHVREALHRRNGSMPGSRPDTVIIRGWAGGRILKVVVSAADPEVIVTAMWEDQP